MAREITVDEGAGAIGSNSGHARKFRARKEKERDLADRKAGEALEDQMDHLLATGQLLCFDATGSPVDCTGSGQDGEYRRGLPLPARRFTAANDIVSDHLTGLDWLRDANPAKFPLQWQEAIDYVASLNRHGHLGRHDWRLPNRIELRSLVDLVAINPALVPDNPFLDVEDTWYWSSTSAAISPSHAWYVHMGGGRMFYGLKRQFYLVWPVCGRGNDTLRRSGQSGCFDSDGQAIECAGSRQDGDCPTGAAWPEPRFDVATDDVLDRLTGLRWRRNAGLTTSPVDWTTALELVADLRQREGREWRLPNINELESLVDCSRASPALPDGHPFAGLHEVNWSSTTSAYEPAWSWALYLEKGAVGVGHKRAARFDVWPVIG